MDAAASFGDAFRSVVRNGLIFAELFQDEQLFLYKFGWEKDGYGLADNLSGGVAECGFRCWIPAGDETVQVFAYDSIITTGDKAGEESSGLCSLHCHPVEFGGAVRVACYLVKCVFEFVQVARRVSFVVNSFFD
jgi:hypothetical protein